jgi:hypothetical protein
MPIPIIIMPFPIPGMRFISRNGLNYSKGRHLVQDSFLSYVFGWFGRGLFIILLMEGVRISETSVYSNEITWRKNPITLFTCN